METQQNEKTACERWVLKKAALLFFSLSLYDIIKYKIVLWHPHCHPLT